jgi:O-antigen/teichoic acid export membrane protein
VGLAAQLAYGLALAAYLGPQGVGAFAVATLVLDTAMVFVNLPAVAFVREYASGEREEALSTVAALKLAACVPAAVAIFGLAGPVAALFQTSPLMIQIMAAYPPVSALSSIATMVFESRRDMVRRNLPGLTEAVGRLVVVVGLVSGLTLAASKPESAAVMWVLGSVPAVAVSFALADFPDLRRGHLGKAREYMAFGWRTTLAQLLQKQLLWVGTAAVYLAFLPLSAAVAQDRSGLFKVAYSLMFYTVLFGTAVGTMVYPLFSRAFARPDAAAGRAEAHRLLSLAFFYELAISVPLAAALVVGAPFAFHLLLPGFESAAWIAQALAVSGVLFCLTIPPAMLLPAANRPDLILRLFIVEGAVALALNAALVPQIDAPWGGAFGAVIADWVTAAVGLVYAYRLVARLGVAFPSFSYVRAELSGAKPGSNASGPPEARP